MNLFTSSTYCVMAIRTRRISRRSAGTSDAGLGTDRSTAWMAECTYRRRLTPNRFSALNETVNNRQAYIHHDTKIPGHENDQGARDCTKSIAPASARQNRREYIPTPKEGSPNQLCHQWVDKAQTHQQIVRK